MPAVNVLLPEKRCQVIAALVEDTSINATCRITGVAKHTVLKLLKDLAVYHDANFRNVTGRRVRCDEIWAFVSCHYNSVRIHKTLRVTPAMEAGITDHVWSFEELLALLDVATTTI